MRATNWVKSIARARTDMGEGRVVSAGYDAGLFEVRLRLQGENGLSCALRFTPEEAANLKLQIDIYEGERALQERVRKAREADAVALADDLVKDPR